MTVSLFGSQVERMPSASNFTDQVAAIADQIVLTQGNINSLLSDIQHLLAEMGLMPPEPPVRGKDEDDKTWKQRLGDYREKVESMLAKINQRLNVAYLKLDEAQTKLTDLQEEQSHVLDKQQKEAAKELDKRLREEAKRLLSEVSKTTNRINNETPLYIHVDEPWENHTVKSTDPGASKVRFFGAGSKRELQPSALDIDAWRSPDLPTTGEPDGLVSTEMNIQWPGWEDGAPPWELGMAFLCSPEFNVYTNPETGRVGRTGEPMWNGTGYTHVGAEHQWGWDPQRYTKGVCVAGMTTMEQRLGSREAALEWADEVGVNVDTINGHDTFVWNPNELEMGLYFAYFNSSEGQASLRSLERDGINAATFERRDHFPKIGDLDPVASASEMADRMKWAQQARANREAADTIDTSAPVAGSTAAVAPLAAGEIPLAGIEQIIANAKTGVDTSLGAESDDIDALTPRRDQLAAADAARLAVVQTPELSPEAQTRLMIDTAIARVFQVPPEGFGGLPIPEGFQSWTGYIVVSEAVRSHAVRDQLQGIAEKLGEDALVSLLAMIRSGLPVGELQGLLSDLNTAPAAQGVTDVWAQFQADWAEK